MAVSAFDRLVAEAQAQSVDSWDFSWLDGRAVEERPSWHFFDRVAERTRRVDRLLDVECGTGNMLCDLPARPALAVGVEGWAPSIAIAAPRLRSRGVHLVQTSNEHEALPFPPESFDLVTSRHPVRVWWREIARVLAPTGTYFAQHVGPHSLRELSEFFVGPLPEHSSRDPSKERREAERAGLVAHITEERPRVAFFDVGAVVFFLRLVVWIVPDFSVERYRGRLRDLHEIIEQTGSFETAGSRLLVHATKDE